MRSILLAVVVLLAGSAFAADATPTVHVVATSHLDTQWRWTIQDTIEDYLLDTLDDNFALLEQYPDYVFNFEGAFRYQLIKEYYPERFERMKRYIAQGRWRVCGSWLDAVDVNMPSPEALYRHALYGNGWFDREFGVRSVDVFLPDCFGFGYALPSIMAHSGLTGFSTQKLTWGSAYGIPFDLGKWRGVDGSEVIAAVNPGAYVSDLESDVSRDSTVIAAVERTVAAGGPPIAFKYYGTGDTGGAPTEGSVQWLEKSIASDGPVTVVSAGADQIYRELTPEQIAALPVYDGELVMTSHGAGCYTSQAAMKRWNRRCEVLGDAAERAATLAWYLGARDYPHEELERAWTRFLWHGFHDDLTGTSIPEAYAFSWNDMLLSQQEFAQVLESSLEGVVAEMDTECEGEPFVVFNPLGHDRTGLVRIPPYFGNKTARIIDPAGNEVPHQRLCSHRSANCSGADGLVFLATVPANGVAVYDLVTESGRRIEEHESRGWNPETGILETDRYRLRLNEEGLVSLVDKRTDRELLAAPPRLQLLHDEPANWAAWEIDHDDIMAAPYAEIPLGGIPISVDAGEVAARLTFEHEAAGSVFRQTLTVAGDRLDWRLDIDWATKATLLKAAFFTTARDTVATYDLGLGAIQRGVNRPQLYEVPAQRWVDVTDASGEFGLTVMNDGRHGWDRPDEGTLRLSLIHTPAVNENWRWIDDQKSQDLGRHEVSIGMMGHGAEWQADAVREADAFNQPLMAYAVAEPSPGPWGRTVSLLHVGDESGPDNPSVATRSVKKSEEGDWLVVRLQETTGSSVADVIVAPLAPIVEYREILADETPVVAGPDVDLRGGALLCDLDPYQPRTFALHLAPPSDNRRAAVLRSEPVPLPWNLDGMSTRESPTDGDLDGTGRTLPAEVIPEAFVRDGVRFATGPRGDGAPNLLRCEGQTIALPRSDLRRVQLLACSVAGPRRARFGFDGAVAIGAWIPNGLAPFGQWDSRLLGDDTVHDPADLIRGFVQEADLGWVATHHREADGRPATYEFVHFYRFEGLAPSSLLEGTATLELPDDPAVVILAVSLVEETPTLTAVTDPVDRPRTPSVSFVADRRAFVDSLTVRVTSPNRHQNLEVVLNEDAPIYNYDGEPIVLTKTTKMTVHAGPGGDLEALVQTATFTRLDPWSAVDAGASTGGLATRSYLGAWSQLPDWTELEPSQESDSGTVTIPEALPEEDIGVVMIGYITAPTRGVYRFWLSSDDGSRLWIGKRLVADHDGLHGSSALWGDAPLEAGQHPITVEFFQHLGGRDLKLEWSGPGFSRREVPANAFSH